MRSENLWQKASSEACVLQPEDFTSICHNKIVFLGAKKHKFQNPQIFFLEMFQNPPIFMAEMFQNSQICFFIIFRSLLSGILYNHTFHRKDTLSLQTDCSSHFFLFDEANIVVISSEKRFILVFLTIRQPFSCFCHLE